MELFAEDRLKTAPLVWFGGAAPISESHVVELTTRYTPTDSGHRPDRVRHGRPRPGAGSTTSWSSTRTSTAVGDDLGAAFLTPPSATTPITLTAGTPVDLRFEIDLGAHEDFLAGALSFQFGTEPDAEDHDALIAEAAEAAADGRRRARGGRHQLDGRVRGLRPRHAGPARPAGRPGRGRRGREPAHGRARERRVARADAVARRRRGRARRLLRRAGVRRRGRRRAARRRRARRPAADDVGRPRTRTCPCCRRRRSTASSPTPRASTSATARGSSTTSPRRTGSATASATPTSRSPT